MGKCQACGQDTFDDDGVLLSAEWLESVGFIEKRPKEKPGWFDLSLLDFYQHLPRFPYKEVRICNYPLPNIETRGQLRQLVLLLTGSPLEEKCSGSS